VIVSLAILIENQLGWMVTQEDDIPCNITAYMTLHREMSSTSSVQHASTLGQWACYSVPVGLQTVQSVFPFTQLGFGSTINWGVSPEFMHNFYFA